MKKFLTAKEILSVPDKIETKELKSAAGMINIKRLSPADSEKLADFYVSRTEGETIRYSKIEFQHLLMSLVIVEEDGKTPIFTDADLLELKAKDAELWREIWGLVESTNPTGTKSEIKESKKNS
jgi:hypothetical protein